MKQRIVPVFIVAATVMFCQPGFSQAQDNAMEGAAVSAQAPAVDSDIQWLWGEVSSVAVEKNEVVVKYLDYEADVEKEMTIAVTDKTTYENCKGLAELKPLDTVSIDYIIADGKSVAKNISVEKPEVMPVSEAPADASMTEAPKDASPADVVEGAPEMPHVAPEAAPLPDESPMPIEPPVDMENTTK